MAEGGRVGDVRAYAQRIGIIWAVDSPPTARSISATCAGQGSAERVASTQVRTPLSYSGVRWRGEGDPVDAGIRGSYRPARRHPEEVEQAVNSGPRYEAPGREDSTLLYSATDDGRFLLVVLAEAVDGRWYVATAREMNDTERRTFRRKGR